MLSCIALFNPIKLIKPPKPIKPIKPIKPLKPIRPHPSASHIFTFEF